MAAFAAMTGVGVVCSAASPDGIAILEKYARARAALDAVKTRTRALESEH
jgi:hypothetical protein